MRFRGKLSRLDRLSVRVDLNYRRQSSHRCVKEEAKCVSSLKHRGIKTPSPAGRSLLLPRPAAGKTHESRRAVGNSAGPLRLFQAGPCYQAATTV
ncbi:hypothetical protein E2C01_083950 [Portunus trituberculatus]|uniref:Uncharacterized protein n=1 Tax=Portunus trituberculatus TaxID=210409 RepID=A0A5B7IYL8_PORTR|nr:hypothetical protein [Portunus trituberculatus]